MNTKLIKYITIVLILVIHIISDSYAYTWYVRKDNTGDTSDLQGAINSAQDGDTIYVGPGLYSKYGSHYWVHIGVHIISEYGPELTIIRNTYYVPVSGNMEATYGFRVENITSSFTIKGFTIKDTVQGFWNFGGVGVAAINSNGLISNNIFINNSWAAIGVGSESSVIIENNLIYSNPMLSIQIGDLATAIIRFNTIYNSGRMHLWGDSVYPTIYHNIICNSSTYGIYCDCPVDNITFECNNVWNNQENYHGTLQDQTGTNGNISLDPLFCGIPGSGNFYLQSGSPCAESNVPEHCDGIRMGAFPVSCSVGVEKESWGKIKDLFK